MQRIDVHIPREESMIRRVLTLSMMPAALMACERTDSPSAPEPVDEAPLAAVQTSWPSDDDPGLPFYVRVEPASPYIYVAGDWAIFVFYRHPGCIRGDFNLIDFFDPGPAFGCRPMVQGTSVWAEDIGVGAPKQVSMRGTGAVPVWLVPADLAAEAVADGELTIGELAAIPGRLTGSAARFTEVVMPHALPPFAGGGGHPNPKITITASGSLEDGRRFRYQLNRGDYEELHSIRLDIR